MRIVSMKRLVAGMIVGKTVYSEEGVILLQQGVTLSDVRIRKLIEKHIPCVYIEDDISEGIVPRESVDPALKLKALQSVKKIMDHAAPLGNKIETNSKTLMTKKTLFEIKHTINDIIEELKKNEGSLIRIVEMMGTDLYTYTHSVNVAILALMIGLEMITGTSKEDKEMRLLALGMGALLHDIGKSMIDPAILNKREELNAFEQEDVKLHVEYGYDMVKDNVDIELMMYGGIIKGCVLLHHENLDGSGYPYGWDETKLKDYIRIIRVADMYAAMTADKVYKKKIPPYVALEQMSALCYTIIDPKMLSALKRRLALYPEGVGVLLSNGEKGIVTRNNEGNADRPFVRIIRNKDDSMYRGIKVVDLMEDMTYFIVEVVDI